jgi:lysophospholipase L1-like esterase
MSPNWLLLGIMLCAGTARAATDAVPLETLTAAEAERLAAARAAVLRSPALKTVNDAFKAARTAYRADRAKFPADRDPAVATAFRRATKDLDRAVHETLSTDPGIAPLLAKRPRSRNAGETAADSDGVKNPAVAPIEDVAGLPRVLLIGDSISIGYTLPVRERLRGRANVHRIPVNGGATDIGLANIGQWLGDGPWDVIHFNFGLHDAKFASATTQRASREEYVENLRTLVRHMKATNAKLVFATTTPVPKGGTLQPGRVFDDIEARNELAVRLMREEGVAIDDLYAVAKPALAEVGRPNDVHFTPAGYDLLADAVAASIAGQLPEPE